MRRALVLSLFLAAVGCGQPTSLPIGLTPVSPDSGEDARTSLPSTLLSEVVKQGVPQSLAVLAFNKYDTFSKRVKNGNYISIVDFTLYSGKPRFYMINTSTGKVDKLLAAHGKGSDPDATGTPTKFSNVNNSKMTSLGAYLISEKFPSTNHGTAARMDGLESSNSLARDRGIIFHWAPYVSEGLAKMGMSWGCPAISQSWISTALARLANGSFLYAYGNSSAKALDEMQLQQMMLNPAYPWIDESEAAPIDGEW